MNSKPRDKTQAAREQATLLRLDNLGLHYRGRRPGDAETIAVDGVNLSIRRGEILGLVGESGSGKSSLARSIVGLLHPDRGKIFFKGQALEEMNAKQLRDARRKMQIIFQNPGGALSPRRTIAQTLCEPLRLFKLSSAPEQQPRLVQALAEVGLGEDCLHRYPHQFSSGQRQRIAIARALICQPQLLIADEAVASLDVSVQAQIIELFRGLNERRGIALLFISHDLAVIRQLADKVGVMYRGRLVESAPAERIYEHPGHPYTQGLLASAGGKTADEDQFTQPHVLNRARRSPGCNYQQQCPVAIDLCQHQAPDGRVVSEPTGHTVECHLVERDDSGNE